MKVTAEEICKGMPPQFSQIYQYIRDLSHLDTIDYDLIEELLFEAAKASDIIIVKDFTRHKFHWLLESKRNTDGAFYSENRTHLQSCDSLLNKSNSDELFESNTLKSFNRHAKEESKHANKSPNTNKNQGKKKKKGKATAKSKRINLSQAKQYTSQVNSFITRNPHRLGSPGNGFQGNKLQARDFKNRMNKMLDVRANKVLESHHSGISSPSK